MQTSFDVRSLAIEYITAAGRKDCATVGELVTARVTFKGPVADLEGAEAFIGALKRMAPVWRGNEVVAAFADGDRAAVAYDFITTSAQRVRCFELLQFEQGRIASVDLLFDRVQFGAATQMPEAANTK